ncbi:MAG: hypothetical protein Pg6C_11030 [Treponemataceae bacterium]|nr:MAG: hypothetical protein Pg6C_11030 [Treponemataceae bacterium]
MHELRSFITLDPNIRFGKPCIKGTRITVGDILRWLSGGMTEQEILEDYPELQRIHIRAVLAFAAALLLRAKPQIEDLNKNDYGLLEIV